MVLLMDNCNIESACSQYISFVILLRCKNNQQHQKLRTESQFQQNSHLVLSEEHFSCSLTVRIRACHARDRGSIPRKRVFFIFLLSFMFYFLVKMV